ncbi:hypothetical protein [Lysinibacillus sphaericus]|uniref:hypothetical protein n=1 Tax=Lysinibacillus sphaericus TaxID=1421 RepID=UPI001CC0278E|nr:hypothetical protein [Lysinibacillus sphaericus]
MKMNEKIDIVIPNVVFAWGSQYHLTTDEFMLYAHLQFMKQVGQWNQTRTSVDMIIQYLGWQTKNKQRDKSGVIANLSSLEEKGYIKIECDGDIKKTFFTVKQIQEPLSVDFIVELDEDGKKRTFKGYTKISGRFYNLANNEGRALMVIAYITWRKKINYDIPKSEWVKVLGTSKSTVENSFMDYKERFLNVEEGDYYQNEQGQIRQETNSYAISDKQETFIELKEIEEKYKGGNYLDKMKEKVTDNIVQSDNKIFMQIFDKGTYIEFEGYRVWSESECEFTKREGQKKIDRMLASKKNDCYASKVVTSLERKYQEYLEQRKQQREWSKMLIDEHVAEWVEFDETPYVKPKTITKDFTAFLDD